MTHMTMPARNGSQPPRGARRAAADPAGDAAETSMELLERARTGDDAALNRLLQRYIPALERWAKGRMSHAIRSMNDTADIVQDAVISAVQGFYA